MSDWLDHIKWDRDGLVPAIAQEKGSNDVLMMAWMNRASVEKTIETGKTHFWSRSRQKFWMKGESSGHVQVVKDIATIKSDIQDIRTRVGMLELDVAKIDQPSIAKRFDAIEGKIDKLYDFLLERLTKLPS